MLSDVTNDELYQGFFRKVYQHTHGYQQYSEGELDTFAQSNICITYGELLYFSVKKMLNIVQLNSEDIFLDLGSGLGKCALQVFMQTEIQKVIGIEASKVLHDQALIASSKVKADFPYFWEGNRQLDFICGNFLQLPWHDASIVYTCSTCFTQELLVAISNKINQHKNIKQVLSLRPLLTIKMPLAKVFMVECSWDSALCFYYSCL